MKNRKSWKGTNFGQRKLVVFSYRHESIGTKFNIFECVNYVTLQPSRLLSLVNTIKIVSPNFQRQILIGCYSAVPICL